jgi:hypothetical protein
MDPEATLEILRATVAEFQRTYDANQGVSYRSQDSRAETLVDLGDTLAEAFDSLDSWMKNGGFRPSSWT